MANDKSTGKTRPVKIPAEKWLTIGKLYYYYTPTKGAPPGTSNSSVKVPAIHIKGRWLDEAGFAIRDKVRIRVCKGGVVMMIEE